MKVIETNDPVLPKQAQFIDSTSPEVLYSGAFGAGKTRAGCLKARQRATTPGAIEGLCRKNLVSLKRTTLRTLLEPDGDLPPVLMPGTYEHHKTEGRITLNDGGTILTFGLDDPQKIGSLNLTGCFVDEATELAGADWTALRGRLRGGGDRIVRQLYGGCNPSGPSHHLAVRFGFAPGSHAADGCKAIQTCSSDNWFLPADYLKSLHTFEGLAYKRFVLGLWVASDRLVYDMWDREKHVQENKGPWSRVAIGVDAGYTNPAVLLAIGEDYDGRLHVFDEFYKSGVLEADFVAEAVKWNARYSPERFVVDPSAAGLIASMRGAGLPVIDANNARQDGVQAVRNRLKIAGDGRPRLTVSNLCSNTIREAETWETVDRVGKEEFSKTGDHACDAARYACMYFDSRQPVSAAPWAPASADVECNRDPEFAAINLDLKDF
jgi:phage terminase large subunit